MNHNTNRITQMETVQKEALNLFKRKNADYGDSFANFGPVGVIVRMGDKINRLVSISSSNVTLIKTESIRDTLIDLHNYAAMAIMLMDENKSDEQKDQESNNTKTAIPKVPSVGHELYLEDNYNTLDAHFC